MQQHLAWVWHFFLSREYFHWRHTVYHTLVSMIVIGVTIPHMSGVLASKYAYDTRLQAVDASAGVLLAQHSRQAFLQPAQGSPTFWLSACAYLFIFGNVYTAQLQLDSHLSWLKVLAYLNRPAAVLSLSWLKLADSTHFFMDTHTSYAMYVHMAL